jgi:type IV pilus assembly protein PilA
MYKALVKMRNKKGFTLMERLIVGAIIAILAAIAIPTFSSSLTKAKNAADEANARSLFAAAAMNAMTETTFTAPTAPTETESPYTVTYEGTKYTFNQKPTFSSTAASSTDDATWTITCGHDATATWTVTIPDTKTA